MQRLGLQEAMDRPISGYSKGMRQRVKLAQALGHGPDVLLLDEPLTGLDPVARREVGGLIRSLGRTGAVVVVSSHVLHELQSVVDRVVLIHQGRLLAEGSIEELREQIDDRPRRMFLASPRSRELAARLFSIPQVSSITQVDCGLEIETSLGREFHTDLTQLGAEGMISEIVPLDSSLESVFGYLVQ
jgi:ABC-2 type transport system ATP-binding protein